MARLVLVDDQQIIREGIACLLEGEDDLTIVGQADNGRRAIELATCLNPDLMIVDYEMPEFTGIEVLDELRKFKIDTRIMVLSIHRDFELIKNAFELGAAGYMVKDAGQDELIRGIRKVLAGEKYLSPTISGISTEPDPEEDEHPMMLSRRECEVLEKLADGFNTKEVAAMLNISTKTVETHRRQIMRKLDLTNIVQLTKYALRHGLTRLDAAS